jgi:hypothetical protein
MEDRHFNSCGAPICRLFGGDVWYPGEEICSIKPKNIVQKNQTKIEKLFNQGKIKDERFFTVRSLSRMERIGAGMKGRDSSQGPA